MPTIEITEHDFTRLQKFAQPFIDTPATAFTKIMDAVERGNVLTCPSDAQVKTPAAIVAYHHDNLPPLTHTKLLEAVFGDGQPDKTTWDALVRLALISVKTRVGSVQGLRKVAAANVVEGRKEDEGYKFVPDHGFSYQGLSAEDSVKIVFRCAKELKINFFAEFEWRSKEQAYRPGERARLEYRVR